MQLLLHFCARHINAVPTPRAWASTLAYDIYVYTFTQIRKIEVIHNLYTLIGIIN